MIALIPFGRRNSYEKNCSRDIEALTAGTMTALAAATKKLRPRCSKSSARLLCSMTLYAGPPWRFLPTPAVLSLPSSDRSFSPGWSPAPPL